MFKATTERAMAEQRFITNKYLYGITQSEVDAIKQGAEMHKAQTMYGFKGVADSELASTLAAELSNDAQEMGMYCSTNLVPTASIYSDPLSTNERTIVLEKFRPPKLGTLEGDLGLLILSLKEKKWRIEDFSTVSELVARLVEAEAKLKKLKGTND